MESGASDEPSPKRQKREQEDNSEEDGAFRFSVGDRVLCNISRRSSGYVWKLGTVAQVKFKPSQEQARRNKVVYEDDDGVPIIPYLVKLEEGSTVAAPEDEDECVRLAARCCADTRIMRQLAVPEDTRKVTSLRFFEGDRVAVQLDVGIWEEGVVIEAWAVPERNNRPLKTWAGLIVPYAVRLDIGQTVLVPFDTDEVIRRESAARPSQKSIAEQLGGTERNSGKKASETSKRFGVCQNSAGDWVRRDTHSGFERPCAPPSPDSP
eukprot:TRINITY_DN78096_c0_g1_i1.p1 TRINITY_DN78096_c0_g1~~TRINITY_DN78096_c0_g1_i1.p1  ORF type:complete len:265 (-),score=40.04 TRINITY_DN78096_c0_g1_i1:368-1162(-)